MQGGIAYFPGLSTPVVIDTEQLPPAQRSTLEGLIRAAQFFALPATIGTKRRGAADFREYTLRVEDGPRDHTVHVTEPYENSELEDLIAALRSHARQA